MQAVVSPGGTANAAQIKEPGYADGRAKPGRHRCAVFPNGAAQRPDFDVNKLAVGIQRHHALVRRLRATGRQSALRHMSVIVEHGASGAGAAAPAAR